MARQTFFHNPDHSLDSQEYLLWKASKNSFSLEKFIVKSTTPDDVQSSFVINQNTSRYYANEKIELKRNFRSLTEVYRKKNIKEMMKMNLLIHICHETETEITYMSLTFSLNRKLLYHVSKILNVGNSFETEVNLAC